MRHGRWGMALAALAVAGVAVGVLWRPVLFPRKAGGPSPDEVIAAQEKLGTEALPEVKLTVAQLADLQRLLDKPGDRFGFPGFFSEGQYVPMSPVRKVHLNGISPGKPSYESYFILHSGRVRWLLSVGLQDRKPVGELMEKMLLEALRR